MSRAPLTVIEWLEDMRRFASRDADRATEVLELIAVAEAADELLDDVSEKIGDFDEAADRLKSFERLDTWADTDATLADFSGDTTLERLTALVEQYEALEAQSFALSELCMAAGLLKPNDYKTDPLPLLRMFLPGDE